MSGGDGSWPCINIIEAFRDRQSSRFEAVAARRNDHPTSRVGVGLASPGGVDVGGCMEIDRASAQRIVAKLGVTLGFLFLLAIIALAFG